MPTLGLPKVKIVVLFVTCLLIQSTLGHNENQSPPSMSSDPNCDDGKSNLCIDWCDDANGQKEFTCYESIYAVDTTISSETLDETIPPDYVAEHICMDHQIQYPDEFVTYGNHRPIWPTYGEYKFLPRTRWLHSCEHGAVILLYHPCADSAELGKFKQTVMNCLRRYIITPYKDLSSDLPFALNAWGHALFTNYYKEEEVVAFIRTHAKQGPEEVPDNGEYTFGLTQESTVVSGSDFDDSKLCPMYV